MPLTAPAPAWNRDAVEHAAAVFVGLALGGVAVLVASTRSPLVALLVLPAAAPFVALMLGDVRRTLLLLVVLDVPLLWDIELNYHRLEGELGALGGLNLSLTTLAIGALYALWTADWLAGRRELARPRLRSAGPLLVFLGFTVASIAWARDPSLALYESALWAQSMLLFVYVASNVRTRKDVEFIVAALLGALALESLAIIAISLTGIQIDVLGISTKGAFDGELARAAGTLGSPNTAAGFLAVLIPLAAAALVGSTNPILRRLGALALALGAIALILTFSRGGWIGAIVGLIVVAILGWRGPVFRARVVAGLALLVLVCAPLYGAVGQRLTGDDEGAARSRGPLIQLAAEVVRDQPVLGVGGNNFASVIPDYAGPEFRGEWLYTVHNQYMLVWAQLGLAALLSFLWLLGSFLRRGWTAWRAGDPLVAPLALGVIGAVVARIAHMTVDLANTRSHVQLLLLVGALVTAMSVLPGTRTGARE